MRGINAYIIKILLWGMVVLLWRESWCVTSQEDSEEIASTIVNIPILMSNVDQTTVQTNFTFDFIEPHARLEFAITGFCEQHNIRQNFCRQLYEAAETRVQEAKQAYYRSVKVVPIVMGGEESSHHSQRVNLIRHYASVRSFIQFQQQYLRQIIVSEVSPMETIVEEIIVRQLQSLQKHIIINRLVFIHSILYPYQDYSILQDMLLHTRNRGLYWEADLITVLHYGKPLPLMFQSAFPEVFFVHVSNHTALFEIPTLRIVQRLAKRLPYREKNTHILYLHTLGQTYYHRYEMLDDWRNMLLYFLVDGYHNKGYHLLESQVFDVLGVNYERNPRRFHGNFWWTTARYLASVDPYALDLLYSNRFEIDNFIFQAPHTRAYMFHNADIDHHSERYPPYCYRGLTTEEKAQFSEEWRFQAADVNDETDEHNSNEQRAGSKLLPGFQQWSEKCHNSNHWDYLRLHWPEEIPAAVYSDERVHGVDVAECQAVELLSSY